MRKLNAFFLCLAFFAAGHVFAQTKQIRGMVTDSSGAPLANVSVQVRNSKVGTRTAENGSFTLQVPINNPNLVISNIGFESQEVNVGSRDVVNVSLRTGRQSMQEVVVTALGIRRADRALGYSVAKVDPNTLVQKSEPDVLKSLEGKVAGVDIRSSQGTPGAATRIQIRGNTSFFGESQPLIIVDGIPYSNEQVTTSNQVSNGGAYSSGIANLDPNDIATINVLKGSSAAALYGSRASNGVLIITTKSGSARRVARGTQVTFKSSVSTETIANYPDYQNEYGPGSFFSYGNVNGSWGAAFKSRDSIPAWPSYKAAYPNLFPTDSIAYKAVPNNVRDLFRRGWVYENSLNFSGGNENSSVGLTVSHLDHQGYVPNASYKRANISLGASTKMDFGLNVSGNFSYVRSNQSGGFYGENQVGTTSSLFARSLFLARNWDFNLPFEDKNGLPIQPNVTGYDNPRWSAKYNTIKTNEDRFVAGLHTDINILKWVRADYSIGTNISVLNRNEVTEKGSRSAAGKGQLIVNDHRNQELESNFFLTLTPNIGNEFSLKTILGHNFNQRTITDAVQTGSSFIARGVYNLSNTQQQQFTNNFYSRRRIVGVYADATFGFRNYAFINATLRNDWSSTLPVQSRSYLYPSVSGSLVFTEALHLQSDVLDFGKIRGGWSKVGRDADPYQLQDVYVLNPTFLSLPTATLPFTSNFADLRPEFTKEVELGTQLSFFKRRAELDFTWYKRKSTNLIAAISTPPSSGYLQQVSNFGGISNKGVEVDLIVRPIRSQSFNWSVHGIFTKNENIVTELTSGVERIQLYPVISGINPYLEPGKPFGYLRGTVSSRDASGNLLIDPVTGWMITADEEEMIGDPNPDYKLGITNTLAYKGLTLNVLWDMTKGGDIYSVTTYSLLGRGVTKDTRDREAGWIIPGVYGDPNNPGQPLLVSGKPMQNHTVITTNDLYFSSGTTSASFGINSATEWNVYDATVYHLREVTLGYDLPKSLLRNLPIKGVSVSLTGRNLWHLAPNFPKYTNFDPEVNSFGSTSTQGIELSAAPTTRRYGLNLNVTF